jgi:hypothetical protein
MPYNAFDSIFALAADANVAFQPDGFYAAGSQLFDTGIYLALVHIHDRNPRPGFSKPATQGRADAAGATGNRYDFIPEYLLLSYRLPPPAQISISRAIFSTLFMSFS